MKSEAVQSARVGGNRKRLSKAAAITSRTLAAMQSRALCAFQRSVARLQALTEDDFEQVAALDLLSDKDATDGKLLLAAAATAAFPSQGGGEQASRSSMELGGGNKSISSTELEDANGRENPTPSLSAAQPRPLPVRKSDVSNNSSRGRDDEEGAKEETSIAPTGENASTEAIPLAESLQAERSPSSSIPAAMVLRVLRATVVVLGGCGLGALPSDRELWEAVKPMLVDGSLRHRVRHFDRRVRSVWFVFAFHDMEGGRQESR